MSSLSRTEFASKLSATGRMRELGALLRNHSSLVDIELARALRDECYDVWRSEPIRSQNADRAMQLMLESIKGREARAIADWLHGIAELTSGQLETSLDALLSASKTYAAIGDRLRSAESIVAALIPLAMLGRYTEALRHGKRALKVLDAAGSELTAGKVELNLSNIAARLGRYDEAERLAIKARDRFNSLGDPRLAAMAENGLGITYTDLGRFKDAERAFVRALDLAQIAESDVTLAEVEASLANLCRLRGDFDEALAYFESSRERFERLGMPHQYLTAQYEIAAIYAELNLSDEAEKMFAKVCPGLAKYKMIHEEAAARAMYADVLKKRTRLQEAKRQYEKAISLYSAEGNQLASDWVAAKLALMELGRGDVNSAQALLARIQDGTRRFENLDHHLLTRRLAAEIEIALGRPKRAVKILAEIAETANRGSRPQYLAFAQNALGEAALVEDRTERAIEYFTDAARSIERMRGKLPGEAFRVAFFADTTQPFANLVSSHITLGELENAFRWHERMRSRALSELVESTRPHERADSGETTKIGVTRRLREQLNAVYHRLDREPGGERSRLEIKARRLEAEIAKLERRAQAVEGKTARASGNASLNVAALQGRLGGDRVLVEYFEREGRFGAFVLDQAELRVVQTDLRKKDLENWLSQFESQLRTFRHGAAVAGHLASVLKKRTDQILASLGERLMGPLGVDRSAKSLIVIPTGPLFGVPFSALRFGGEYLIERHAICLAPSASMWLGLAGRTAQKDLNAAVIGHSDQAIPFAEDEAREVAAILDSREVLTGPAATTESFKRAAGSAGLLHVACHGLFRADNPMYSSLQLADGRVTAADVAKMRLNSELVTLSACETGRSEIAGGDEMLGLARGFLSAGARGLIMSLWNVSDRHTIGLMRRFYSEMQRTHNAQASLQSTQVEMLARGLHPYFWAPFCYIGS